MSKGISKFIADKKFYKMVMIIDAHPDSKT